MKPTAEQAAIVDAFATGANLIVEAGAGSGKTSTLRLLGDREPRRRGLYLAYNRAIKEDAARTFPASVRCSTSHGLAFGPVATRFKHRLGGRRVPARLAAQILGINDPVRLDENTAPLAPAQLARMTMATVSRFCYSADEQITDRTVPVFNGLEDPALRAELAKVIVPYARRAWSDLSRTDGQLRFEHDVYLKMYQLSHPTLRYDYLLVDEAQDLNPVVKAIVEEQTHAQICLVGDRCQAIYGWRGAVDAMSTFAGQRLYLTQSFRFGQPVADEANKWLTLLGAKLRLRGFNQIRSTVGPVDVPDAVLTRSNATAMVRIMRLAEAGHKVALVGGGGEIAALARAAQDLAEGRGTDHPELLAFSSWREVQVYAEMDEAGADLKVLVDLVDKHTPEKILATVDLLAEEADAQTVVSTAHKSKGREWPRVQIADDFREPRRTPDNPDPEVDRGEAMLAYVAVTRAQHALDNDGLSWVDRWLPAHRRGFNPAQPSARELLDTSSLGTPGAQALIECGRQEAAARLTGMPEEQADWESDLTHDKPEPAVVETVRTHCRRCGTSPCLCDPTEAARWSAMTGQPAGPNATITREAVAA